MNKDRYKRVVALKDEVEKVKCQVRDIQNEERRCWNNLPDCLRQKGKGQDMEDNIDCMDEVIKGLDDVLGWFYKIQ